MKAILVEGFHWCPHANLRGFTIEGHPGIFVLDMGDIEGSLDREIERYGNEYAHTAGIGTPVVMMPWSMDIDYDKARQALKEAAYGCG
jgi:hypothetical protein